MDMQEDKTAHQKGGMCCPSCGAMLELNPVDHNSEASGEEDMPSMEEAQSMPLDKLRERLPKKSEY